MPGTQRPGGRTERNRRAVARAVLEMLSAGELELRPETVAEAAGVSRSTVYRRWPTRESLLREAHREHTQRVRVPDTGSFEQDIRQLARSLARFFSDPTEIAMSAAMAANLDPGFTAWEVAYWRENAEQLARPFAAAEARGEIGGEVPLDVLIEMLIAPMIVRTVVMKERLPRRFVDGLASAVISAARASS